MLDVGQTFFASQIVEPLSDNSVYQSYRVSCAPSSTAKLLVFKKDRLSRSKERRRFTQRVQQLAEQDFPDIALPYRAGEEEGQLCCLYPLPAGQPLADLLATPFSVRRTLELLAQIAQTLRGPHGAGLVHGQISPATIFLAEQRVCLADFALAELVRLDYQSGLDPHYVSPEQVRGAELGTASDLYSLGAVAFRLLTGKPPFAGEDAFAIAKQHLQGAVLDLPESLSCCRPVLHAMTRPGGTERISAQELYDELQTLLTGSEIDQLPEPEAAPEQAATTAAAGTIDGTAHADEQDEFAARIEQRLQEHVGKLAELPEESENPAAAVTHPAEPPEYPPQESRIGRYLLILLLGVALGSGAYFLFFQPPVPPSAVAPAVAPLPAPEQEVENPLTAELNRALNLWRKGDTAAEEAFRRIKQNYSQDPRAYNNLAVMAAGEGDYDRARNLLELALMTDSNYATIYRNLGSVYAEMARDSYGKALQLEDGQAYLNLQALSGQGPVALAETQRQTAASELAPSAGDQSTTSVAETPQTEAPQPSLTAGAQEQQSASVVSQPLTPTQEQQSQAALAAQSANGADKGREVTTPSAQPQATQAVAEAEAAQAVATSAPAVQESTTAPAKPSTAASGPESPPAATEPATPLPVESFLRRWAQAWSDQDVERYLRHYADNYDPVGNRSLEEWRQQRRERLQRPDLIKVNLAEMEAVELADGRTQVTLIQSYTSDSYADKVRKVIDLQPVQDEWRIIRERSLGRVQ